MEIVNILIFNLSNKLVKFELSVLSEFQIKGFYTQTRVTNLSYGSTRHSNLRFDPNPHRAKPVSLLHFFFFLNNLPINCSVVIFNRKKIIRAQL